MSASFTSSLPRPSLDVFPFMNHSLVEVNEYMISGSISMTDIHPVNGVTFFTDMSLGIMPV
jgi:hypothetical protein